MQTHRDDKPKYQHYIDETTLPDDYLQRSILFDMSDNANDKLSVKYKSDKYTSVNDYRTRTKYPSKIEDQRPEKFSFERFCAHGTTLASVLSSLRYSNKQLVPGIKLRKLFGKGSSSGESLGTTILDSKHINNKKVSAIKFAKDDDPYAPAIYIAFSYSEKYLSGQTGSATNFPVIVIGEGVGECSYAVRDNEVAYPRINIRILAVNDKDEQADVLATLSALKIYDVKVCLRDDVKKVYDIPVANHF